MYMLEIRIIAPARGPPGRGSAPAHLMAGDLISRLAGPLEGPGETAVRGRISIKFGGWAGKNVYRHCAISTGHKVPGWVLAYAREGHTFQKIRGMVKDREVRLS